MAEEWEEKEPEDATWQEEGRPPVQRDADVATDRGGGSSHQGLESNMQLNLDCAPGLLRQPACLPPSLPH